MPFYQIPNLEKQLPHRVLLHRHPSPEVKQAQPQTTANNEKEKKTRHAQLIIRIDRLRRTERKRPQGLLNLQGHQSVVIKPELHEDHKVRLEESLQIHQQSLS